MLPTPCTYSLVSGAGEGATPLNAFDQALLASGLGNLNLLKVTSILPPEALEKKEPQIPPGSLVPTAFAQTCSSTPGQRIAAAVAVGISHGGGYGVIMECSGCMSRLEIEDKITQMVRDAFEVRGLQLLDIKLASVEHIVVGCGAVFAGLALWY